MNCQVKNTGKKKKVNFNLELEWRVKKSFIKRVNLAENENFS